MTMFEHISKHLEVHQKYSAARRIFNSHLDFGNVVKHCISRLIRVYYINNSLEALQLINDLSRDLLQRV